MRGGGGSAGRAGARGGTRIWRQNRARALGAGPCSEGAGPDAPPSLARVPVSRGIAPPVLPSFPRVSLPGPGSPMDAFVVKLPRGQAGDGGSAGGKRPRLEGPGPERPPPREIRAEGLSCDYRILFSKAEADEIFQELEKEVEYFEGIFLPWEGARAVQGGSGGLPKGLDSALGHPAWAGGWPG